MQRVVLCLIVCSALVFSASLGVAAALPSAALAGTQDLEVKGEVLERSGDDRTVRFTLTNLGPDAVDLNCADFCDDLYVGINFNTVEATVLSEAPACVHEGDDPPVCGKTKTLAVGESRSVQLAVRIQPDGDPSNRSQIGGGVGSQSQGFELNDPNPANDGAGLILEDDPQPRADLSVGLIGPTGPVRPGRPTEYLATVSNAGPDPASDVVAAAALGEQVTLLGGLGSACTGLASLSCSVGTLAPGDSQTIRLVGIPRHPSVTTTAGSGASAAAVKRDRSIADVTVRAQTPDPNSANDRARSTTRIRARYSLKGPKGKLRRGARPSASKRWRWGPFEVDGYYFGLEDVLIRSSTGFQFGLGGWTVGTRMAQAQKKKRFGFWPELYMVAEYRVRIVSLTPGGKQTYSTQFPNGSGTGFGSGGTFVNPSWKVNSRRLAAQIYNWKPRGTTSFALKTAEQTYQLEGRFRFYRNRLGPDKVKDTNWYYIDSVHSGRGYSESASPDQVRLHKPDLARPDREAHGGPLRPGGVRSFTVPHELTHPAVCGGDAQDRRPSITPR